MLFSLDRLLVAPELERELRRPRIVLQDRSYFSTLAYQSVGSSAADRARMSALQRRISRRPDRVVWLDLSPAAALGRIARRGRPRSSVERRRFLTLVRAEYARLSRGRGWLRVDADRPLEEVVEEIDRRLRPFVDRRGPPARGSA